MVGIKLLFSILYNKPVIWKLVLSHAHASDNTISRQSYIIKRRTDCLSSIIFIHNQSLESCRIAIQLKYYGKQKQCIFVLAHTPRRNIFICPSWKVGLHWDWPPWTKFDYEDTNSMHYMSRHKDYYYRYNDYLKDF